MNTLYIVQQHSENDNGRDRIDLFKTREAAVERFYALVREYKIAYGEDNADDRWELEGDGCETCAKRVWTLPDETTAEVYLSDVSPSDED